MHCLSLCFHSLSLCFHGLSLCFHGLSLCFHGLSRPFTAFHCLSLPFLVTKKRHVASQEVIAIHQDPWGKQARRVSSVRPLPPPFIDLSLHQQCLITLVACHCLSTATP